MIHFLFFIVMKLRLEYSNIGRVSIGVHYIFFEFLLIGDDLWDFNLGLGTRFILCQLSS